MDSHNRQLACHINFMEMLSYLQVPRNGVVFVHSSVDWLKKVGLHDVLELLHTLIEWISPDGTLVMPSYPYIGSHVEYLRKKPFFYVQRTPSVVGLLTEIFRRSPDVRRSLEPDHPLCVYGKDTEKIISYPLLQHATDPFGPGSRYRYLLDNMEITLLGLGVSLNTNSFMHVIDSKLQQWYDFPLYTTESFEATVIDYEQHTLKVTSHAVRDQIHINIKPSTLLKEIIEDRRMMTVCCVGKTQFFRLDLVSWQTYALEHGYKRLMQGRLPIWLEYIL